MAITHTAKFTIISTTTTFDGKKEVSQQKEVIEIPYAYALEDRDDWQLRLWIAHYLMAYGLDILP